MTRRTRIGNATQHARTAAGVCARCGKVPPRPGLTTCAACGTAHARRSGRWYTRRYAARKAAGLCPECGRRTPRPGYVSCAECGAAKTVYMQQWYAAHAHRVHAAYVAQREARWERPGANMVACCGGFAEVVTLASDPPALVTACCKRVLGFVPQEA